MASTYDFPAIKRGDTFSEKVIAVLTETDTGDPVAVAGALLQVRQRRSGAIVHEWSTAKGSIAISGAGNNTLTMAMVQPATTAKWPPGVHDYDLQITLADADSTVFTAPEGTFTVTADVSRA